MTILYEWILTNNIQIIQTCLGNFLTATLTATVLIASSKEGWCGCLHEIILNLQEHRVNTVSGSMTSGQNCWTHLKPTVQPHGLPESAFSEAILRFHMMLLTNLDNLIRFQDSNRFTSYGSLAIISVVPCGFASLQLASIWRALAAQGGLWKSAWHSLRSDFWSFDSSIPRVFRLIFVSCFVYFCFVSLDHFDLRSHWVSDASFCHGSDLRLPK